MQAGAKSRCSTMARSHRWAGLHTSARDYASYVSFLLGARTDRNAAAQRSLRSRPDASSHRRRRSPRFRPPMRQIRLDARARARSCTDRHARLQRLPLQAFVRPLRWIARLRINVLLIPEHDIGVFAFANRTYAPAALVVRQASARLYDTGTLKAVSQRGSDALVRIDRPSRRSMRPDRKRLSHGGSRSICCWIVQRPDGSGSCRRCARNWANATRGARWTCGTRCPLCFDISAIGAR
jgi:hypothetical protein